MSDIEITLPNLKIAAKTWGNPKHPPLLALHGWLDNAATFDRLAPLLEGFYVIAPDLPGHGISDHRPPGIRYHYVDYLDDVLLIADALQWQNFILLGHSLGGALASILAATHPERISALCLIEALGPLTSDAADALKSLRHAIDRRADLVEKTLRIFANAEQAVKARQQANGLSVEAATTLVSRGIRMVDGGYSWSSDSRLTLPSPTRLTEAQILNYLQGIKAPTCLILADPAAPYLQPAMMQARIDCVANLQLHRLSGSHHLHLEDATPTAKVFNAFLAPKKVLHKQ